MPTTLADKSRITARVPAELRDTLEQAAQLQGATLNQFVVQSAFQEAQRIVERETLIRLSQRDAQKVFSLLDHPPQAERALEGSRQSQPGQSSCIASNFSSARTTGKASTAAARR